MAPSRFVIGFCFAALVSICSGSSNDVFFARRENTSHSYKMGLSHLKGNNLGAAVAYLSIATQSQETFFWPEATIAFMRRLGRGLAESCDDAAGRLMRLAMTLKEEMKEKELKIEVRKRYLHDLEEVSSDEDVVQFHEYAAGTGEAGSQLTMGNLYLVGGHGLPVSFSMALRYFQQAADQGDARGLGMVAFMLEKGYGTDVNPKRALSLYQRAAAMGDFFAQTRLGKVYEEGRLGVAVDTKQAETLYSQAAKAGSSAAWYGLGTLAVTANDEKKAAKLFAVAIQKGSLQAAFDLARIQLRDTALCPLAVANLVQLFDWSPPVVMALQQARSYFSGPASNVTAALEIYEQLAWAGVEEAQSNAAFIHHRVLGNMTAAIPYYELSAQLGSAHSHLMLGDYFYYQRHDLNASHSAYRRAADLHNHEAMFNLGYMYHYGEGVPTADPHLAKRYYDLALATNPSSVYAVYLSLLLLYGSSYPLMQMFSQVDLFWWCTDTVLISLLCIILTSLLVIRQARA